jgi:hypothetical protein
MALGQHIPPRVQYRMTCLIIRNTIGCVSCSEEWELAWCMPSPHGAIGPMGATLSLQVGPVGETIAKYDILL